MSLNIQTNYSVSQNNLAFKAKAPKLSSYKNFKINSKEQLMKTMDKKYLHYLSQAKLNKYMSLWKQRENELSSDDFIALADKLIEHLKKTGLPDKLRDVPPFFDQLIKLVKG